MLVVMRYRVEAGDREAFLAEARTALEALAARPGCTGGSVARSVDEPDLWVLQTSWTAAGAYRRALSAPEVKVAAVPLMYRALQEPSAYEPLVTWTPDGGLRDRDGDLAPDAAHATPGRRGR